MPHSSRSLFNDVISRGLLTGEAIAKRLRAQVAREVSSRYLSQSPWDLVEVARNVLNQFEPLMAQSLSDTEIAGWIFSANTAMNNLPQNVVSELIQFQPLTPPLTPPGGPPISDLLFGEEAVIRFPRIENAVNNLVERNVVPRSTFDTLSADAKARAFTVARIQSENTINLIRDVVRETVQEGASLGNFKNKLGDQLKASFIGPAHLENVYRTNVQSAFSEGLERIHKNPIVNAVFPYARYDAIDDTRVRPEHLALMTLGIDGTNIFRADDPFWEIFTPPIEWNCRCSKMFLTRKQAARKGVSEAARWERTGEPPEQPEFRLQFIPFRPDPKFASQGRRVRRLSLIFNGHTPEEEEIHVVRMARSPKGGITIEGKFFKGGQFIPSRWLKKATNEQLNKVAFKPTSKPAYKLTREDYRQSVAEKQIKEEKVIFEREVQKLRDWYREVEARDEVFMPEGWEKGHFSDTFEDRLKNLAWYHVDRKLRGAGTRNPRNLISNWKGNLENRHREMAKGSYDIGSKSHWQIRESHAKLVRRAVEAGKDVPEDVLLDYAHYDWSPLPEWQKRNTQKIREFKEAKESPEVETFVAELQARKNKFKHIHEEKRRQILDLGDRQKRITKRTKQLNDDRFDIAFEYDELRKKKGWKRVPKGVDKEIVKDEETGRYKVIVSGEAEDPEHDKIFREYAESLDRIYEESWELIQEKISFGEKIRDIISSDEGVDIKFQYNESEFPDGISKVEVETAKRFLDAIVSRRHSDGKSYANFYIRPIPRGRKQRAYANGRVMYVPGSVRAETIVHELGHLLDNQEIQGIPGKQVGTVTKNYMLSRTKNQRINSLGKNYDIEEITTKDHFTEAYTGKYYREKQSSEVLSMGLQQLFEDPVGFAKNDPDHFEFTLGMLDGTYLPTEEEMKSRRMAVARAPAGYTEGKPLIVDGKPYVGGEFIPGKSQKEVDKAVESQAEEVSRVDKRTGFNVSKNLTTGATTTLGYAGMREGFLIRTSDGASVKGYVNNADFGKESSSKTRGEVFYVEVPEDKRGGGIGTSLVSDAIRLMKANGVKTVGMNAITDDGKKLNERLVSSGVISGPISKIETGKEEYLIGTSESKDQTDSEQFKSWFGDSKVVDEKGNPLVVFHGTPKDFNTFDINEAQMTLLGRGFYFTESEREGKYYGDKLMPVFLSVKNPWSIHMPLTERARQSIRKSYKEVVGQNIEDEYTGIGADWKNKHLSKAADELNNPEATGNSIRSIEHAHGDYVWQKILQKAGFDGQMVISRTKKGTHKWWIVFSPNQIKSAVSNRGTFDPTNPDIRMALRARAPAGYTEDNPLIINGKPYKGGEYIPDAELKQAVREGEISKEKADDLRGIRKSARGQKHLPFFTPEMQRERVIGSASDYEWDKIVADGVDDKDVHNELSIKAEEVYKYRNREYKLYADDNYPEEDADKFYKDDQLVDLNQLFDDSVPDVPKNEMYASMGEREYNKVIIARKLTDRLAGNHDFLALATREMVDGLLWDFRFNETIMLDDKTTASERFFVRRAVQSMISSWARSSSDHNMLSMLLQRAAIDEFDLPDEAFKSIIRNKMFRDKLDEHYEQWSEGFRAFVREMYINTQELFQEKGVEEVILYRGMNFNNPDDIAELDYELGEWHEQEFTSNPLSSWTTDFVTASSFANTGGDNGHYKVMVSARIPVNRIISTPITGFGASIEDEFVVMGGQGESQMYIGEADTEDWYPATATPEAFTETPTEHEIEAEQNEDGKWEYKTPFSYFEDDDSILYEEFDEQPEPITIYTYDEGPKADSAYLEDPGDQEWWQYTEEWMNDDYQYEDDPGEYFSDNLYMNAYTGQVIDDYEYSDLQVLNFPMPYEGK